MKDMETWLAVHLRTLVLLLAALLCAGLAAELLLNGLTDGPHIASLVLNLLCALVSLLATRLTGRGFRRAALAVLMVVALLSVGGTVAHVRVAHKRQAVMEVAVRQGYPVPVKTTALPPLAPSATAGFALLAALGVASRPGARDEKT